MHLKARLLPLASVASLVALAVTNGWWRN